MKINCNFSVCTQSYLWILDGLPQGDENLVSHDRCIHSLKCRHSLGIHNNQEVKDMLHYQLSFGALLYQSHQSLCLAVNKIKIILWHLNLRPQVPKYILS